MSALSSAVPKVGALVLWLLDEVFVLQIKLIVLSLSCSRMNRSVVACSRCSGCVVVAVVV